MKKRYVAPLLVAGGSVVCETRGQGMLAPREAGPNYKPIVSGTVGFYL
jgi:hypothetical protein